MLHFVVKLMKQRELWKKETVDEDTYNVEALFFLDRQNRRQRRNRAMWRLETSSKSLLCMSGLVSRPLGSVRVARKERLAHTLADFAEMSRTCCVERRRPHGQPSPQKEANVWVLAFVWHSRHTYFGRYWVAFSEAQPIGSARVVWRDEGQGHCPPRPPWRNPLLAQTGVCRGGGHLGIGTESDWGNVGK
eukprot:symbB.v1.2.035339.t1/scaffold4732.1/size35661/2